MTECQIITTIEPMFSGPSSPMIVHGKCTTHLYSFDGPISEACPIGMLEKRLDQMEKAFQAVALNQRVCFKEGRLAAVEMEQKEAAK